MEYTLTTPLMPASINWTDCSKFRENSRLTLSPTSTKGIHIPPLPSPDRTWSDRAFGGLAPGCQRSSVMTLVGTAIGTGVLALPYSIAQMGFVLGCSAIFLAASGSLCGLFIIASGMRSTKINSYGALIGIVGHGSAEHLVDICIALNALGCCVSYMVFLGDFVPSAFKALNLPTIMTQRTSLLCGCLLLMFPFSFRTKLSSLRHISMIPLIALAVTSAAMVIFSGSIASSTTIGEVSWFIQPGWNTLKGFNVCVFSFMQHVNICPIVNEMMTPSDRRVWKTIIRAVLVEGTLYILIALVGIVTFGMDTKQNFLQNYPQDNGVFIMCRLLLALSMIINVPMNLVPAVRSTVCVIEAFKRSRAKTQSIPSTALSKPMLQVTKSDHAEQLSAMRTTTNALSSNDVAHRFSEIREPCQCVKYNNTTVASMLTATPITETIEDNEKEHETIHQSDDDFASVASSDNGQRTDGSASYHRENVNLTIGRYGDNGNENHENWKDFKNADSEIRNMYARDDEVFSCSDFNDVLNSLPTDNAIKDIGCGPRKTSSLYFHRQASLHKYYDVFTTTEAQLCSIDAEPWYLSETPNSQMPYIPACHSDGGALCLRIGIAMLALLLSLGVSLITDQVADVISLVGGLFATTLMFTFPAFVQLKLASNPAFTKLNSYVRTTAAFLIFCCLISYIAVGVILCQSAGLLPS